jgi:multiple sugar transport system substrate-binding protein
MTRMGKRLASTASTSRTRGRGLAAGAWRFALLLAGFAGCGAPEPAAPKAPTYRGLTLHGSVLAPPGSDARPLADLLRAPAGEWSATRGAQVDLPDAPIALADLPADRDWVLFPALFLGDLMAANKLGSIPAKLLRPTPRPDRLERPESESVAVKDASGQADDPYAFGDILPELRDQVIRYGGTIVGLPVGSSALVLAYRRDAFERDALKAAASGAGVKLEPPETYEQLDALARFLHEQDWDGDGKPGAGIALALREDADDVAAAVFLARAAALGLHPDYFGLFFDETTMEPRIASQPFVDALEATTRLAALGPEGAASLDARAARQAFREGRAALLIDRADAAREWTNPDRPIAVAVVPLPGSSRVFDPRRKAYQESERINRPTYLGWSGGWLISPVQGGKRAGATLDFLEQLTSTEGSARLVMNRAFPLLPARGSQAGQDRLDPRSNVRGWGRAVARTLTAPRMISGLRLPGASDYHRDLETARRAATTGAVPAATALQTARDQWNARTQSLGRERQQWHYRRSLNIPTAGTEPPAPTPATPAATSPASDATR